MRPSTHTAPALHLHAARAIPRLVHVECFPDHARLERLRFAGVTEPVDGRLAPDVSNYGMGLEWRAADSERYRVT